MFAGVDGCRSGWVAVVLSARRFRRASFHPTFALVMDALDGAQVIGVDMPLGLLHRGSREADAAARSFLRGRASSVFDAPVRSVLRAGDHATASQRSRERTGKGLSKQSFNLIPKIREVDAFADDERIHEVHPEVSFQLLAGEALPSKKTWGGMRARMRLLAKAGIEVPELDAIRDVGIDDVLDAAVVAWSARRIARGRSRSFPETPTQRDRGRVIAIHG